METGKKPLTYSKGVSTPLLPNGLRLVIDYTPEALAGYCGVMCRVGSRDEEVPEKHGLAHFVEHTIFKGTERRRAWHIINRMEAVGGELNAYTTKEETVIYTAFPGGHAARAIDLLSDLVRNSTFPDAELEKERQVVADEIDSYRDVPADAVFDDFEDRFFAGSGLGHNILGSRESLDGLDSRLCRSHLTEYFRPDNMVFYYSGPQSPERIFKMAAKAFGGMAALDSPLHIKPSILPNTSPFIETIHTDNHQANTVIGARTKGLDDPDPFPMALLTNILGGPGMNSLLNVALRERRGLVYTVEAQTALFSDVGLFTVYYGCDPGDVDRCRRMVLNQIDSMAQSALTPAQLSRWARQLAGQTALARENREGAVQSMARRLLYGCPLPVAKETMERIMSVSPAQLQGAAQLLLSEKTSTLVLS